ncbi:hypothetical protein COH20_002788 [Aspergillus flavus]|uniref:DNA, SC102 n=1 Tax=Aspergillus oryzae (strain ATCC 42149 / RIB 40) TaxID=510516 RepID=Q2UBB3_ASPOR|nr:unnamed protein product [Aspergillus oryzae RIB40]RAQ60954.1 hypothetical protein COH21_008859 [Aspergillus flavus]RAQ66177.1 hypothetical protein COH20_002788 [Aspergillus flavus]BAE61152.1 unnamed protein product [Aspergillus oryzae RIB40]
MLWWLCVALLLVHHSLAGCPAVVLPQPDIWPDGKFLYPNGAPQCFTQGSIMNISWETKYKTTNLYLVHGANYDDPVALTLNTAATWHEWRVGYPTRDDTKPFVLRLVNAQGTPEDMAVGGIWSARFWIGWNQDTSSSSTLAPTPTPTEPATVIDASRSHTTTSASPANSAQSNSGSSSHGKAIGIGIGVGLGVPLCSAVILALLFLRRRRNQPESVVHGGPFAPPASDKSYTNSTVPEDMCLEGKQVYELCGESSRTEADSSHVRYELA